MTVQEVRDIGKGLRDLLHTKTVAVGINLFKNVSDIPKEYTLLQQKKVICNVIGFSRFYEEPLAIRKEDTEGLCLVADISLGFSKIPTNFGEMTVGKFASTIAKAQKIVDEMKSLPSGEFVAIGVCPLNRIPIVPDIVQIWGNPTQMLCLIYANTWNNSENLVELTSNGHGGSCYETLTQPLVEKKVRMAVADIGDKRHGNAGDDEMILGLPVNMLKNLYEGLEATMKTHNKLPVLYNFIDIPFPTPDYAIKYSQIIRENPVYL